MEIETWSISCETMSEIKIENQTSKAQTDSLCLMLQPSQVYF